MKGKTEHCGWKSAPQQKPCPCDRYKHACVVCRGFVYLHGGRNMTSLRDFWRYNIAKNEWEMLDCSGDGPEELEEHSMVAYKGNLYIFGGMVDSAFTQAKIPLWTYDTDSTRWTECRNVPAEKESLAPANRKGHSAVVYHSSMYIFGGYFGIKGISQEFWTFHFDTGKWLCVSSPSHNTGPGPRHGHSAVVYRTGMYLFGGLMGLSEQKDLWKWDFVSSSWSNIRTSQGPPPVVGHASIVCKDSMLIFGGGISNSSPNDDLWKYHFHTQTWKKLSSTANFPPKMYHCILGIGVDFQTTSDFTNTSPSHWKNDQKGCGQLVPIPRHTRFGNYFRQRPTDRAFGSKESNAIEMKTFSLPLEPVGFRAFQTTSEAELDPNRDTSLLTKDESLPLFPSSERETLAAAQVVGEEEGSDCGCATAGDELGSSTNTLLLIGGKPLSSFAELSFRQMEFDSS
ncbi:PREDICTED: tip elongation aberrant protein 3-like isoform X1 [Lepidothrix coronata]|uniref:Tip elongation aberrant protein 3-like isoform X1 n=1 Tax=Lepidothrix coronata TaxID=321398 RepID=A0A6J0HXN8_9PASS|nr:PREDICTED: tip elongation aberrant protein 3-like isoform X1 [Lepidothrix coronata]XP_017679023.1 PREDICTED: tip elongation aberrant protein 3-like isoform X1 [Lepidothrix coronata]XP_017679024.1 PREDICTED: tip elongation aberrant protein 3-like isoform X1 [Lepidothrix coronata]XP_017679025.1 PREDICTED: tip elongation aberrant protein 3-like isoform X1 [Lepidothrix coronata]